MTSLTVASDADTSALTRAVLSSLPLSYRPADDQTPPAVTTIGGTGAWADRVDQALGRGSAAVVVVHPEPTAPDVQPMPGLVVLDSIWADNAAVGTAAKYFRAGVRDAQLIECRIVPGPGRTLAATLVDAFQLIRALFGPATQPELLHHTAEGFLAGASVGGLALSLWVNRTSAIRPGASVRLLTDDGSIELTVPHPATARPAELVITNSVGALSVPSRWESSHRTAWRRAHALVDAGSEGSDLPSFLDDQITLSTLLTTLST